MPDITPAQLSLELHVNQKRIRDALRDQYGALPSGVTRWELNERQADVIRSRFASTGRSDQLEWTLEPGDVVLRRELHAAYGGSRQNGIVTLKTLPDILVFTSVQSGSPFGYDLFEGLQPDGSYAYTGEGQRGDQAFTRGNRALRDSGPDGRPIRLFAVKGTSATYVGEFATGDPTCRVETIPDSSGHPRTGIIFNLVPVNADSSLLAPRTTDGSVTARVTAWTLPDSSDVVFVDETPATPGERVVSRIEFALQADFGAWLRSQGHEPQRLSLSSDGTIIEPDLYVESRGWIVEAKRSSGRDYVRTAIGQVLDYVHVAMRAGISATPVILLPGYPTPDVVRLLATREIALVVRSGSGFEVVGAHQSDEAAV
ncbi:hypothetical protein [Leifsonia shinshuensis]